MGLSSDNLQDFWIQISNYTQRVRILNLPFHTLPEQGNSLRCCQDLHLQEMMRVANFLWLHSCGTGHRIFGWLNQGELEEHLIFTDAYICAHWRWKFKGKWTLYSLSGQSLWWEDKVQGWNSANSGCDIAVDYLLVLFEDRITSDGLTSCGWMGRGRERGVVRTHDSQVYQIEYVLEGWPEAGEGVDVCL